MIYVDTSIVLAYLLAEAHRPADVLWDGTLIASRLLEYETWTGLHARNLAESHGEAARTIIGRIALLELSPVVLTRALMGFPMAVRTLDALHLASIDFLRRQGQTVELATYDRRMADAARAMGVPVVDPAV